MQLFEGCWERVARAEEHRQEGAALWNEYIAETPHEFRLVEIGEDAGKFAMIVSEQAPPPLRLSTIIGEWLFNLRAALDNCVYDAAIADSGQDPPPSASALQFPICDSPQLFAKSSARVRPLHRHTQELVEAVQPYMCPTLDNSALWWLNELARLDRHRALSLTTALIADAAPAVYAPSAKRIEFEPSDERPLRLTKGEAILGTFSVYPFAPGDEVSANPDAGIDFEIVEWAKSPFWRKWEINWRMRFLEISSGVSVIAPIEYSCLGRSRFADALSLDFRDECSKRGPTALTHYHTG